MLCGVDLASLCCLPRFLKEHETELIRRRYFEEGRLL